MCTLLSGLYVVSEPTYSAPALLVSGRNSFILVHSHNYFIHTIIAALARGHCHVILSSTLAFQLVVVECYFVIHTISSLEALKIASQAGSQSGSQSLTHFISVDKHGVKVSINALTFCGNRG